MSTWRFKMKEKFSKNLKEHFYTEKWADELGGVYRD